MNILFLIWQLIPNLLQTIVTIESTAPVPQTGVQKAALVKDIVTASLAAVTLDKHAISQDRLLSIFEAIVASIVSFYNLIGIFKKTPPVTAAPVTPAA